MPLQTNNLVMIGLGVLNDTPPFQLQSPLNDGIHLRWAFSREVGFPWYGYYLFRRPHEKRGLRCMAHYLRGRRPEAVGASTLITSDGIFSSDTEIVLTDDFPDPGVPEIDLHGRRFLQLDLPTDERAFRLDIRIGFREAAESMRCVDLTGRAIAILTNPFVVDGVRFEVRASRDELPAHGRILPIPAEMRR